MQDLLNIIRSDEGQGIAEYAAMLAVILVLVVGTIRLVGSNANNGFFCSRKFEHKPEAMSLNCWVLMVQNCFVSTHETL